MKKGDAACIALEKLYHSRCFTCFHCSMNLENIEFYNLNGEPYCKKDYSVSTLYKFEQISHVSHEKYMYNIKYIRITLI